ncbi:MAG: hypothetical protein E7301_00710 [Butyrivibrio sp.]|nr:hypothetical protein [Butyrivibrio sp.]
MKFSIDIDNCEAISNKFELLPDKVRQNSAALESVSDCLILCGPEYEIIKATLDVCIKNLSREAVETDYILKAFKQIIQKYKSADKTIVGHSKGGNNTLPKNKPISGHSRGPSKPGKPGITWPSGSGSAGSNNPEKTHGKEKQGSGLYDPYFLFREPTANSSGSYEYDTDPSNFHVNAEGEAHAYGPSFLFGYGLFNDFITVDEEVTFGYAKGEGKVGLSLFDEDGRFNPQITGKGKGTASLVHEERTIRVGNDDWNVHLTSEGDLGYVSVDGEGGLDNGGVGSAGIGLAQASVTPGVTIWGIDIDASGSVDAGSVGGGGGIYADEDNLRVAFDIEYGGGIGIDINIDWADCPAYQWAKDFF